MYYTIGELAALINLPPSTLRYYDKKGLLPFLERSESGIRLFKDSDLETLKVIDCLKQTGMPLKDIRRFILLAMQGDAGIKERLALICRRKETVLEQLRSLQDVLAILSYKEWFYRQAEARGTVEGLKELPLSEVPSAVRKGRELLQRRKK